MKMKNIVIVMLFCLFLVGCKDMRYQLVGAGVVTRIEIIGGGFMHPAKKVFYLDDGSFHICGYRDYPSVRIGDHIYVYYRDWDGMKISRKPINEDGEKE